MAARYTLAVVAMVVVVERAGLELAPRARPPTRGGEVLDIRYGQEGRGEGRRAQTARQHALALGALACGRVPCAVWPSQSAIPPYVSLILILIGPPGVLELALALVYTAYRLDVCSLFLLHDFTVHTGHSHKKPHPHAQRNQLTSRGQATVGGYIYSTMCMGILYISTLCGWTYFIL